MSRRKQLSPLEAAIDLMPRCLGAGFDFVATTSLVQLYAYVQTTIDLYEEGEDTDIRTRKQYEACRRYLALLKADKADAEVVRAA